MVNISYIWGINKNLMPLSVMKKTQDTTLVDPRVDAILKARRIKDTTKPYSREESIENINKITRGEMKPGLTSVLKKSPGKTTYAIIDRKGDTIEVAKEDFEKKFKKQ